MLLPAIACKNKTMAYLVLFVAVVRLVLTIRAGVKGLEAVYFRQDFAIFWAVENFSVISDFQHREKAIFNARILRIFT